MGIDPFHLSHDPLERDRLGIQQSGWGVLCNCRPRHKQGNWKNPFRSHLNVGFLQTHNTRAESSMAVPCWNRPRTQTWPGQNRDTRSHRPPYGTSRVGMPPTTSTRGAELGSSGLNRVQCNSASHQLRSRLEQIHQGIPWPLLSFTRSIQINWRFIFVSSPLFCH